MRSPLMLVSLVFLIAPALAGAQDSQGSAPAAPAPASAPAPADAKARAPAKSRSVFGQAMAELTHSVEASRDPAPSAATPPAAKPATREARPAQVATHDPQD